jgi:hypothetical protein
MRKLNTFIFICLGIISCHNISFDSEKWKNWAENESNMFMRIDMANDLISNYNLIGKSSMEIEKLLGKPNQERRGKDCVVSYDLGPCRAFGPSYGVLDIEIRDGKVIDVNQRCH